MTWQDVAIMAIIVVGILGGLFLSTHPRRMHRPAVPTTPRPVAPIPSPKARCRRLDYYRTAPPAELVLIANGTETPEKLSELGEWIRRVYLSMHKHGGCADCDYTPESPGD